jgi:hypothetical protein
VRYDLLIGIDYSGAEHCGARLKGLQVYAAENTSAPARVTPPPQPPNQSWNWSRKEVAEWIVGLDRAGRRFLVAIDHAFSFPATYFSRYGLKDWDAFLGDFCRHWPTHRDGVHVDSVREMNPRTGEVSELRLTDQWTSSAKSVFQLDGQGTVGKSSHAGIPWLFHIREAVGGRVHFWPFDGWDVPVGRSVIAEAYPSIFRRRFLREERGPDAHDAYAIARWLREVDDRDLLDGYFHPPLTEAEAQQAELEGWILGIR